MSSGEREKEKVESVEVVESVDHFYHEHPLTLGVVGTRNSGICDGCRWFIYPEETAYTCREGCLYPRLHEECAEMPREIRMSMHPQHTLIQKEVWYGPTCAVCEKGIYEIGYYCSSLDRCKFQVHVGCAQNMRVTPTCIDHPSHPEHPLKMLCRPGGSCLSRCDGCGTKETGNSYICIDCQYWIHESCATLPATTDYPHLHHHPLSLIYHIPLEYIRFDFRCHICFKDFLPRYWVYHCATCRYVAHIKCVIKASPTTTMSIDANAAEDKDVIVFPTNNAEEMIRSFVSEVGGAMPNPNEMVNAKYKFHSHNHDLHLISSSLNDQEVDEDQEEDEEEYKNYDDGLSHGTLVCDGCTMPISPNKQKSSSSSSSSSSVSEKYYCMSCGECKYFLHWPCFHLPPELPSHPLHLRSDHSLSLQTSPKLDFTYCYVCGFHTNGLFYKCTECDFKADIKCISLPNTIKHEAHPRHLFKLLTKETTYSDNYWQRLCDACDRNTYGEVCYRCDICQIIVHSSCVVLPAVVRNPEWDKHPLPLTFDASVDHPSDFYCDICEQQMNPKSWMYHCRACDFSLHPRCFPTASGEYRNIKFGQRYSVDVAAPVHHHQPLRYQLLTIKLRCDVCGRRKNYGTRGFQCTSHNCDFFMCLNPCGSNREALMQAVD